MLVQIAIVVFIPHTLFASFEYSNISAEFVGRANTGVAKPNSAEHIFFNPAGISNNNSPAIIFSYCCPYGIQELKFGNLASTFSVAGYTTGIGIQYFGNQLYKETLLAVTAAKDISNIHIGVNLRYANLNIQKYGHSSAALIDIGFLTQITPAFSWGFTTHNITNTKIGEQEESLPQIFQTGILFKVQDNINIYFDLNKSVRYPMDIRSAFSFKPFSIFSIYAGMNIEPSRFACGFSLFFKYLKIDYAFNTHSDLGLTHHFSFTFQLE
jgi:hypothetical protein